MKTADMPKASYIPVEIEKVLELEGAIRPDFNCPSSVYAHISKAGKVRLGAQVEDVQYALIAIFPQHGIMHLGDIDPETKRFRDYDPHMKEFALYTRAKNHVVEQVLVRSDQIERLKTLDEVLSIDGISVKRELIPE